MLGGMYILTEWLMEATQRFMGDGVGRPWRAHGPVLDSIVMRRTRCVSTPPCVLANALWCYFYEKNQTKHHRC